jgi:hypothetical protein
LWRLRRFRFARLYRVEWSGGEWLEESKWPPW